MMRNQSIPIVISLIALTCAAGFGFFFLRGMKNIETGLKGASQRDDNMAAIREGLDNIHSRIDQLELTLQNHQDWLIKLEASNQLSRSDSANAWAQLVKRHQEQQAGQDRSAVAEGSANLESAEQNIGHPMELVTPEGRQQRFEEIVDGYRDTIFTDGIVEENIAQAYEYTNTDIGRTLQQEGMAITGIECNRERCLFEGDISRHIAVSSAAMAVGDLYETEDSYHDFVDKIYQMLDEIGMSRSNTALQRNGDQFYIYARIKDQDDQ